MPISTFPKTVSNCSISHDSVTTRHENKLWRYVMENRREFVSKLTAGLGLTFFSGCADKMKIGGSLKNPAGINTGVSSVSVVKGSDRRAMIRDALEPFREQIANEIQNKQVVIKLNCVGQLGNPLMVTPPDAIRGTLDFLKPIYGRRVIVAESTVADIGDKQDTFKLFDYTPIADEFNVKLVELNEDTTTWHWILDGNLYPQRIRVIDTLINQDNYIISVTRLKTHNCVVATLSLKNVVMGSPLKIPKLNINDKAKMHATTKTNQSTKMINLNLFLMAQRVKPDFCILDGFVGVEGNGPANGTPVDHHVAVAGPDFVSVDRIGTELMGIPFENIGYLTYCADAGLGQGDRSKIKIIGENPADLIIKYKLHENINQQY